jgi:hypothetical protein
MPTIFTQDPLTGIYTQVEMDDEEDVELPDLSFDEGDDIILPEPEVKPKRRGKNAGSRHTD